ILEVRNTAMAQIEVRRPVLQTPIVDVHHAYIRIPDSGPILKSVTDIVHGLRVGIIALQLQTMREAVGEFSLEGMVIGAEVIPACVVRTNAVVRTTRAYRVPRRVGSDRPAGKRIQIDHPA